MGFLHDYVPFYFAPRSPMLYAIHKGNVPGYSEGQNSIIHLVIEAEEIECSNLTFAFTDGHAVIRYSEFYDDIQRLDMIDWKIMQDKFWGNKPEDGDRKRRRQAEFLVHQFCPCSKIKKIGVINSTIQAKVEKILQSFSFQIPVMVYNHWYY